MHFTFAKFETFQIKNKFQKLVDYSYLNIRQCAISATKSCTKFPTIFNIITDLGLGFEGNF